MSSSHYAARVTMDSSIESEDEPPNRYTDQEALKIKHQQIIGYDRKNEHNNTQKNR